MAHPNKQNPKPYLHYNKIKGTCINTTMTAWVQIVPKQDHRRQNDH